MELVVLFGCFVVLLALGVPVAFCLGLSALATLFYLDIPLIVAFQRMAAGIDVFALLAIPFFIFAGELMNQSGIAAKLVRLAESMLGRARGGLGQVSVLSCMMFGAVSGSAVASVSAMGSALTPIMSEKGYSRDFAVNVTATGSATGLLIPPSHNMIIYSIAAGGSVSIVSLFLAGLLPGILLGLALMAATWLVAVRRGYPGGAFPGWRQLLVAFVQALPGLLSALIIVGGILSGIFTATESSAIAVVYTVVIAAFVYRSLNWSKFATATRNAVRTTAIVMLIIAAASAFGWLMAVAEVPLRMSEALLGISENPLVLFLIINLILLMLGTFMDMAPLIIITTPIFLPVATQLGMDPVQFGVVMILNLGIGLVTPPVGAVLFVGCAVGGITIEKSLRSIWPFYCAMLVVLLLVTAIPSISLALPGLFD
ncbi:MAG: TRAP transporter large permease [Gammaproteobacteria bacterium]|nr:TRAP transporter large permease [Gammaproteobacteria bacterium]